MTHNSTHPAGGAGAVIAAAREFCRRVEAGEVRSKRSYAAFKEALSALSPTPPVPEPEAEGEFRAVSDNGKRWRIVPDDGDWEMVVVGHVTSGQAKGICTRIAAATARLSSEAEIADLRANLERMRQALEPFAEHAANFIGSSLPDDYADIHPGIALSDYRRARQALSLAGEEKTEASDVCA